MKTAHEKAARLEKEAAALFTFAKSQEFAADKTPSCNAYMKATQLKEQASRTLINAICHSAR